MLECETTIIGTSSQVKEVNNLINQVAKTTANVIILGESGTGKELIARKIHEMSGRVGPFLAVNCGAIPAELLESELFGHEKGAFTGAVTMRKGRFELAQSGTIFLDEIGDMPLVMQVKLLRVLQDLCIERIGSTKSKPVDVRVISATNVNLESAIESGKFREDLFYRLNVFPIEISPLRERKDDIAELISHYLKLHKHKIVLPDEVLTLLYNYNWPGNVRELFNVLERLAIIGASEPIGVLALPNKIKQYAKEQEIGSDNYLNKTTIAITKPQMSSKFNLREYLATIEKNIIEEALVDSNWIVARAATLCGIRRTTLVEKMKKYKISK